MSAAATSGAKFPRPPLGKNTKTSQDNADDKVHTRVGSKTDLILSPDQKSIQLVPEAPKQFSHEKSLIGDSTTTSPIFREDVRQEWINAIFGTDFFPVAGSNGIDDNNDYTTLPPTPREYTPPRQGMGLAQIPSYLSYTATIKGQNQTQSLSQDQTSELSDLPPKPQPIRQKKIGVTLSRIPIGVYVRTIDIQSEAFVAGIVPGSLLVDINGMGVLGEPSHKLLERLWLYEGHFASLSQSEEKKRNPDCLSEENDENVDLNGYGMSKRQSVYKGVKDPVALTLIKDGQLYTAILIAGSPFGISWAPCGNFALVQRAYSFAQKAGVRRGCIVAAVNDKSLREMDHLDTAMHLKEEFSEGKDIRIVCVYTPAESRTSFHERHGANASPLRKRQQQNEIKTIDGVRIRKVVTKRNIDEKPTEYGVGSFFSCGTGANYTPITNGADEDLISAISNRVAAGEVAAPTGMRRLPSRNSTSQKLGPVTFAQMVSDRSLTVQESTDVHKSGLARSLQKSQERYNECPSLEWSEILNRWNFLDSLVFCLRMHAASYSEEKFSAIGGIMGGSNGSSTLMTVNSNPNSEMSFGSIAIHSIDANLNLLKGIGEVANAAHIVHSYLLQLVALISTEQLYASVGGHNCNNDEETISKRMEMVCNEVIEFICETALKDDDLCQSLHFLLRSSCSSYAKTQPREESKITPIKILTAAHCLLRSKLLDRDNRDDILSLPTDAPTTDFLSDDSMYEDSVIETSSTIMSQNSPQTPQDTKVTFDAIARKSEKKSLGKRISKMFKGKSKKNDKEKAVGSSESTLMSPGEDTIEGYVSVSMTQSIASLGSDENYSSFSQQSASPDKHQTRKLVGFRPKSILRKAADQNPEDSGFGDRLPLDIPSKAILFENMGWFLSNLDHLCGIIEKSLLKSFSQKVTDWALQPWSDNKDRALAESTTDLRNGLKALNSNMGKRSDDKSDRHWSPVLNPMDSSEVLFSIVPEESYILPSAHFPLLLAFDSCPREESKLTGTRHADEPKVDMLYRTQVTVVAIRGENENQNLAREEPSAYIVHAAVGGSIKETGRSTLEPYYGSSTHRWHECNALDFESRLPCSPDTVELRISAVSFEEVDKDVITLQDERGLRQYSSELGFSLVDISQAWANKGEHTTFHAEVYSSVNQPDFDQDGEMPSGPILLPQKLSVELEITTEAIRLNHRGVNGFNDGLNQRRMLLYKHDEDMRQEMLAIQFLKTCDKILKASGLDLKMKKYDCIPVGENKGFIEWVPGALSLSDLCKPMGQCSSDRPDGNRKAMPSKASHTERDNSTDGNTSDKSDPPPSAFVRTGGWCKHESLRSLRQSTRTVAQHGISLSGDNPIQDFLRSNAYDASAPYLIRKDVMDTYIKSCAGYCVVTYLLGVGDRHTDNLLLHPRGHFLHCDYSFILGQDPKTYLPMRITEHMVNGMGGRDSDNFAKFLSLAGAAFVTLRRPSSVRVLMSLVKGMTHSNIPDVSINQKSDAALQMIYQRFCLDVNDDDAVAFLEENIERSLTSKIWIAVDAMHSFGKRF